MIVSLLLLQWWSLRGRVVRSLRMLRQPKYLFGVIVGGVWIGWWTLGTIWRSDFSVHVVDFHANNELRSVLELCAPLALAIMATISWLVPWGRLALPFKEAELHQLLPAPISRRRLIQYGLLKSQVGILFSSFFLSLFAGSGGAEDRARTFVAFWTLFTIWDLNGKWRALFLLRQRELPVKTATLRRAGLIAGFGAYWIMIGPHVQSLVVRAFGFFQQGGLKSVPGLIADPSWTSLLQWLTPLSLVTRPLLAESWGGLLVAMPAALGVLVAHHEFVVRSRVRFEDQALAHATRVKDQSSPNRVLRRKSQSARRREPFPLPSIGSPEIAILWKNLMQCWRFSLAKSIGFAALLLTVIVIAPTILGLHPGSYAILQVVGVLIAVVVTLTGGLGWRNDLRAELAHLESARTWPVAPNRLVLAEVLSSALLSFLLATFGIGLILASSAGAHLQKSISPTETVIVLPFEGGEIFGMPPQLALILLTAGLLPFMAGICFSSSALQNLAVLWLPAWVPQGQGKQRGIAALGQRLVSAMALALLLAVVTLPSAILVGLAVLAQWGLGIPWSAWAFPFWGLLASIPTFIAATLLVGVGGKLWEGLDASGEVLEAGQ